MEVQVLIGKVTPGFEKELDELMGKYGLERWCTEMEPVTHLKTPYYAIDISYSERILPGYA